MAIYYYCELQYKCCTSATGTNGNAVPRVPQVYRPYPRSIFVGHYCTFHVSLGESIIPNRVIVKNTMDSRTSVANKHIILKSTKNGVKSV